MGNPSQCRYKSHNHTMSPSNNHAITWIRESSATMYYTNTFQTIMSMTPIFLHINPDIFPNPHSFLPERWIDLDEKERQSLEHYFVPYSKGTRQCAGIK